MRPGAYTALVTPFKDEAIDLEGLKQLITLQIEAGIEGIVVLGSTGEAATLSNVERAQVIRAAVAAAKGRCAIVVGTGSNSTAQTIEHTRQAMELGADGALVVTPYYNKPSQEGIFRHMEMVSKATPLPLIVYNVPSRTARNIETGTMRRLAELENIVGVKESSGDMNQISEVVAINQQRPFLILSGDDYITLPLIAVGGHGVISVVSNLTPKPVVELVRAALHHRMEEARRLNFDLYPLYRGAFLDSNPICIKAMMEAAGLPSGGYRLPLCEPTPSLRQELNQLAARYV
jgi:4-hydroxy-tetrahydrodipicolinate synthase